MDSTIISIIIAVICLAAGILAGKFIFSKNTRKQIEDADQQSQKILSDAQFSAETLKKEKLLEAKERFVQLKSEHEKEVLERNRRLADTEIRAKQKEQGITWNHWINR
jgi:ribonucrease Y